MPLLPVPVGQVFNRPGPQFFICEMGVAGQPKAVPVPGEVCEVSSIVAGDLVHLISGALIPVYMLEVGVLHSSLF